MKRIDRAMYAIFLLVLLADVARAQAVAGGDASGGLSAGTSHRAIPGDPRGEAAGFTAAGAAILSAATHLGAATQVRISASSRTVHVVLAGDDGVVYRRQFKAARFAHSGSARSLFDQHDFGTLPELAEIPDSGFGSPFVRGSEPDHRPQTVFEHTGSPAP